MKKELLAVSILFILVSTSGCSSSSRQQTTTPVAACPPLPQSSHDSDLFGTWTSTYGSGDVDTLVILENGTYKQIFTTSTPEYNFESNWEKYSIERRPSGYIWIHFTDMHRCDDVRSLCSRPDGGVDPNSLGAIDYCEEIGVNMTNEVILVLTGSTYSVHKGIVLRQMRLAGSDWSYVFKLQK